jgi:NADPH-dependent 2,4-dienoyl-CoA reductase/sulfur reductase-like enzyme
MPAGGEGAAWSAEHERAFGEVDDLGEVDVAVVGAGPAGIAAACRAAEAGARVVVLDEAPAAGGQIWRRRVSAARNGGGEAGRARAAPAAARAWFARLERSGARLLTGASVFAAAPEGALLAESSAEGVPAGPAHALLVRARSVVLATGARERFLPFPGWTLPNVVGVGGAQALLKSGAAFRRRRVVVAGSGPLLLPVAAALAAGGARLALVAEQAAAGAVLRFGAGLWRQPAKLAQAARYRAGFARTRYCQGVWVTAATGDGRVEEVTLTNGRRSWAERCDVLACAYGLVPNLELARLLGCEVAEERPAPFPRAERVAVDEHQRTSVERVYCAGEPAGLGGLALALLGGQIAGLAAAGRTDQAAGLQRRRDRELRFAARLAGAFQLRDELRAVPRADTVVCRCEDVALGELDPAWAPRQAKLYSRAGMGPCQGRVCGPALAFLFGWESDTVRPPARPVQVATLAGMGALGAADAADDLAARAGAEERGG